MKENNSKTFIIFSLLLIICVFIVISIYNIMPKNDESNSYYVKVNEEINANIESLNIDDGKVIIQTSGGPIKYCIKSTRSTPNKDALCWKEIVNNEAYISIIDYKTYYIWLMDINGQISNYIIINSKGE